jgi:type VII secretion-associated serine protease mycosin
VAVTALASAGRPAQLALPAQAALAAQFPLATQPVPVAAAAPGASGGGVEPQPREAACRYNDIRDIRPFPNAALSQVTWPQRRLGYQQAHRYTAGQGIRVAVIDSGVQGDQPQLAGQVRAGFDLTTGTPRPGADTDCATHGTLVAGIIAAHHRDGIGFEGVAPGAEILPVRETWGVDDNGQATTAAPIKLVNAINLAVQQGARVVNVSITVDGDLLDAELHAAFRAAVRNAAAHNVVIVAASGNADEQVDRQPVHNSYPAALAAEFDNVIAVGGIAPDGTLYKQSVYGKAPYVTVVAPADTVVSTFIEKGRVGSPLQTGTGTSFAAPFVTGTVALLQARFPGMPPSEIKRRIEQTADHPATNLPSVQFGWGVVNPVAALTAVVPPPATARPAPRIAAPLPPPGGPDLHTRDVALAAGAGAMLVAVAVLMTAAVVPRGRRRKWRPGRRPELPASP